jgi:glyceraldehyde-3-phosphate dehydrogenase/erythrose-4-phosphate dehydrogenase
MATERAMRKAIILLVKVMAWYDNEMGYTHTLVEHVARVGGTLK